MYYGSDEPSASTLDEEASDRPEIVSWLEVIAMKEEFSPILFGSILAGGGLQQGELFWASCTALARFFP